MALLSDGNPNDTIALTVYESAILDVANIERINLDVKLTLATEEVSEDVIDILLDHAGTQDPQATRRRAIGVSDVVVTAQLKRWHALHTLEIVYRDAFNNQLNDRYLQKFQEYRELSRNAREHTMRFGIGLVASPLPQADAPAVSTVTGGAQGGTFYVEIAWVNAAGQVGEPSNETALSTTDLQNLVVTPANPPPSATGFNVYIGTMAVPLALQNDAPIPVGGSYTMPDGGVVAGPAPGMGQTPDTYVIGGPMLRRG